MFYIFSFSRFPSYVQQNMMIILMVFRLIHAYGGRGKDKQVVKTEKLDTTHLSIIGKPLISKMPMLSVGILRYVIHFFFFFSHLSVKGNAFRGEKNSPLLGNGTFHYLQRGFTKIHFERVIIGMGAKKNSLPTYYTRARIGTLRHKYIPAVNGFAHRRSTLRDVYCYYSYIVSMSY